VLGIVTAAVLAPALLVWNIAVFNFVMVPAIMLAFARYPIRMSRAWVFVVCIASSIYGLVLTVQMLAFVSNSSLRPLYALTWVPDLPEASRDNSGNATLVTSGSSCTCGCDFPVSFNVCVNLFVVGVATTVKSVFVALRCLKGLRRCEWANLLLVTFPVPLTAYSVDWRTKDGSIIRHRMEGMPVQGEVAFDPFAMMDEQPDSVTTTIHLRPEPITFKRQDGVERGLAAPRDRLKRAPTSLQDNIRYEQREYIGCCGFPWPTGGVQATYDPAMLDSDVEEDREGSPNGAGKKGPTCLENRELLVSAVEPPRKPCTVANIARDASAHLEDVDVVWPRKTIEVSAPRAGGCPGLRLVPASPAKPQDQPDVSSPHALEACIAPPSSP
jgi:hypothetical protein